MGSIFKFLQSLTRLASKGDIKIDDAYKFAKQEFGEVSDLLKLQINKIFKQSKAPSIKNPEKKPGEVIEASFKPGMDKKGKVVEKSPSQASGIMASDEASPLMKNIDDVKQNIKGMSENNPKTFRMGDEQRNALGYPNRMIEGIIRTAAREILSKKGIDVSKADPIDTFADIFGVNSLERLEDVSDELLSAQDYKQLNSILQKNELYDVTPKSGLNLGQSDEIEELTEFDPTGRKPSAMGGRIGYADGPDDPKKIKKLIKKIPKVGKVVSGVESLVNLVNKKFGKGTAKTADELESKSKPFDDFSTRNPDPKREMTADEYEEILGMSEEDILMKKYPGMRRELAEQIANDPDPKRKADVISMVEQALKMDEMGMSGDEIIDAFKKGTDRTKQANGGLSYLMGM